MPRWLQIIIQSGLAAGQYATATGALPQKAALVIGGVQVVLATIASSYNPDGTTAKVAYEPKP